MQPLPPKKEVLLALLERSSVFIHLDPRRAGTRVPAWFQKQPQLVLQIGLNMPVPIRDLAVEDDSVSCTLSFNRSPFFCVLPWPSVYAMVGEDGRGMVWPEDVPEEVARQAEAQKPQGEEERTPERAEEGKRAHLRAVPAPNKRKDKDLALIQGGATPKARRRKESTPRGASNRREKAVSLAPEPPNEPAPPKPEPPPPAPRPQAVKKPKREIPPYLRVIK